jgi:type 1 glutamine amidotransferase
MTQVSVLLITKGHPFDKGPFFEMFDSLGVNYTHVEQPAARVFFNPAMAKDYDVLVMYDMPGIQFKPGGPEFESPDEDFRSGMMALLKSGKGMVFLHHAIAGWPAWDEYAEIVGGRFLYLPSNLRNEPCQDSGYRHDVPHTIEVVLEHPMTEGLPSKFDMTDELYLGEVFTDDIIPVLRSEHKFVQESFYSAAKVVREGKMFDNENWEHREGCNIVGWIKNYSNSPIAYLQGGDNSTAYTDENYRLLLSNAILWAASNEALGWAASRNR